MLSKSGKFLDECDMTMWLCIHHQWERKHDKYYLGSEAQILYLVIFSGLVQH
jgi:hypothetical protein